MSQDYTSGDFLVFQIEAGFGLLRLLAIDESEKGRIWHVAAYNEMFLDVDDADEAIKRDRSLTISNPHLALTTRAFEATQTARMENRPLTEAELEDLRKWRNSETPEVSDLSVRLHLGLR